MTRLARVFVVLALAISSACSGPTAPSVSPKPGGVIVNPPVITPTTGGITFKFEFAIFGKVGTISGRAMDEPRRLEYAINPPSREEIWLSIFYVGPEPPKIGYDALSYGGNYPMGPVTGVKNLAADVSIREIRFAIWDPLSSGAKIGFPDDREANRVFILPVPWDK